MPAIGRLTGSVAQKLRYLPAFSPFSLKSSLREAHTQNVASLSSLSSSSPESAAEAASGAAVGAVEKKQSPLWRLFKSGLLLTTTAALGGAAYVTYGYDVDSVENKVSSLRSSNLVKTSEDTGFLDVSTVISVDNVKIVSLGDLRFLRVHTAILQEVLDVEPTIICVEMQKVRTVLYSTALDAGISVADFYVETRKNLEDQVRGFAAPSSSKLLPDLLPHEQGTYTLVLDLNETLVYSDWKRDRGWRTFKRPGVEAFLEQLAHHYELVIYSDQLSFYVEPVLERLDQKGCIRYRLSRDATQYINGKHLRDLTKLNRDPSRVIYLSGHAVDSSLQPENSLPIKPWKLEADDTGLLDLLPFLEFVARQRPGDIRPVLASYQGLDIAAEFRERTKEYQRKMQERKQQSRLWRGSAISRPTS